MLNRYLTLVFICCLSAACSMNSPTVQHSCEDPRPEACTREYVPVCAIKSDKSEGLYANGCSACSNSKVVGYNEGACPQP
jgi:hypothetical protein